MKIQRAAPVLIALMAVILTLSVTAGLTQAAPNGGVVGTGTPGSCTDSALNTALIGGGTVTFDCGGPATITATLKTISANTTIDGGNNITLTSTSGQLFNISSGVGLTLTNLTIANVSASQISQAIVNRGPLVMSNTNLINNSYLMNNYTANSTANFINSTFISNTGVTLYASGPFTVTGSHFWQNAPSGNALFMTYNNVTGTIDSSDFISNNTTGASLLYGNGGSFIVTNSHFQQNTGSSSIVAYAPLIIDNSDFISNTTSMIVYATRPVVVSNSRFNWNRSGGYASVIYMYGFGWTPALTLTNSSLMSNTASGGAIYNYYGGTAYISNTQFVSNTSTSSSGALYLDYPGTVQVLSSTFQLGTGGGIYVNGSANPLVIADSQFISNTSQNSAGAIDAGTLTVTHSSFISNTSYNGSGAIDASRQAYITGSTFLSNTGTWGGAMELSSGGFGPFYDVVANSTIKGNTSTTFGGGGIRATQYLTLIDSDVSNNTVVGNSNGGGLYFANGYVLTATNTVFQNNIVTGTSSLGGGIYFQGTSGIITGSTILSNSAGSGGGVYQNSGPLQIVNTVVQSNTARTFFGGGLESHDAMTLRDVNVSGNRNFGNGGQGYGGGLYVASFSSPLDVNRSLFYNNVASNANSQGGGIYLTSPAFITNTTIYSNSASNGGSGLNYNTSYVITLTQLTIMSNTNASGVVTSQLNNTGTAYRVTLVNTLIGGSNGGNCAGNKVLSLGHNLSSDASCAITTTGDLSSTQPLLGAFANNGGATFSFMPQATSPAVNAADNARCTSEDQRGVGRPIGAACDIGSIESPHLTPQTITFAALPNHPVSDAPFVITATASSGLTVTFTSLTSSTCAITGTTVTLISGGVCTLRAAQSGDAVYSPAPTVDRSFNVQYLQLIFWNPLLNKILGDPPFALNAQAGSALPVSYASLTTSTCTVSGITVTLVAGGQCTLRASQPGNAEFAPAPDVDQSFTVLLPQTITFNSIADHIINNGAFVVTATASSGLPITYASLTTSVCTINSQGLVSPVSVGLCTLRASQGGNGVYGAAPVVDRSFNITDLHYLYLPLILR